MRKKQTETKQRLLASLHLLVYLPAFILSSLHVHEVVVAAKDSAGIATVLSVADEGQSSASAKDCACPFCQFLAMPFFCDAGECGSVLYPFNLHHDFFYSDAACRLEEGSQSFPRAPPFLLLNSLSFMG